LSKVPLASTMPIHFERPFTPLQPEDMPPKIATLLLARSALHILPDEAPMSISELNDLRLFTHENREASYLASQTKTYTQGDIEDIIHIIDASPDGEVIGWGEVRRNLTSKEDYFKDKPFVGSTHTIEERRHEGLASRRLLVMRLATSAEFGLALHSDTLFSDHNARKIWEHMVRDGLATKYIQNGSKSARHPRYRFN